MSNAISHAVLLPLKAPSSVDAENSRGVQADPAAGDLGRSAYSFAPEPIPHVSSNRLLYPLQELAQVLASSARIKSGLNRALEVLCASEEVTRSAIVLCRRPSEMRVEASCGLTPEDQKALLRVEDGIADRVLDNGKPVLVHKANWQSPFAASNASQTINQLNGRTFVGVPIVLSRQTAGALLLDMPHQKERDYDLTLAFANLVASMVAHALTLADLTHSDKCSDPDKNLDPREIARVRVEGRERCDFSNLVGNSGPMQHVYDQISKVADTNATVIVRGESGTGKELIAQALHSNSPRKDGPFIKVNCAALPDSLIESELFGFEKGAFTGAVTAKKGRFELAEGGTLFLDEVGELNPSTSAKLLRVLQEREFERLGGTRTIKTNVRLVVATNKDLEKAIVAGTFREDLYYRLNVFAIFIPPLRDRKPDILLLADHFLELFNITHGKNVRRISTSAIDMLMSYHWPGNVRELSNTIERAVLLCDDHVIHGHHLPPTLQTAEATGTIIDLSLKRSVEAYEKGLIQDTLKTTRGNCARAAKLLRTTERIINYKARKYNIDCSRFKACSLERARSADSSHDDNDGSSCPRT